MRLPRGTTYVQKRESDKVGREFFSKLGIEEPLNVFFGEWFRAGWTPLRCFQKLFFGLIFECKIKSFKKPLFRKLKPFLVQTFFTVFLSAKAYGCLDTVSFIVIVCANPATWFFDFRQVVFFCSAFKNCQKIIVDFSQRA